MIALNRLGTAIAISSLSLAMLGCGGAEKSAHSEGQNNSQEESTLSGTSNDVSQLTPINTLSISDYSLDKCIKSTGREFVEEVSTLICNNKGIQFLDGIEQLTELNTLHLNFNHIEDITPLVELKKLKTLYLSGNQIYNLNPLSELSELMELGIQKNLVQDLSPLQSIYSLKSLHAHSNKINDFSILNNLNLAELSGINKQDS
jgi:Leucine-rich repeat (LRR) protein